MIISRYKFLAFSGVLAILVFWKLLANAEIGGSKGETGMVNSLETIVVGGGCFWCIEAVYQNFKGIEGIESGYSGGTKANPTYDEVSAETTGHAEVVKVTFNPAVITLDQILTIFFHAHAPTTKDRQGNDVGAQYRSIILYSSETQRNTAISVRDSITKAKVWGEAPIITEIEPLKQYYKAEAYHQNYYQNNSSKPYCSLIIGPKIRKIRAEFKELLKQ